MNKKPILVVEDNQDEIDLMTRAAGKVKIDTPLFFVSDGMEAVDYLLCEGIYSDRSQEDFPVCVLLDLMLPGANGFEILEVIRFREKTSTIPVIVFSSSNNPNDIERAYKTGANSYIRKPIDFREFTSTLEIVFSYWIKTNQQI